MRFSGFMFCLLITASSLQKPRLLSMADLSRSGVRQHGQLHLIKGRTFMILHVDSMKIPYYPTLQYDLHQVEVTTESLKSQFDYKTEVVSSNEAPAYREFAYLLARRADRYWRQKAFVRKMFMLFDINGDHVIDKEEMKADFQLLGVNP